MKIKIINTTTDSIKTAKHIAELLVSEKLSPCVHIIPNINSIYHWQDKIEHSIEYLLTIKTISNNIKNCIDIVKIHHNYENPELIVVNGEILLDKYRDWFINNSLKI